MPRFFLIVARRLLLLVPVIFLVVTFVFLLVHLVPGDPARLIVGENASELIHVGQAVLYFGGTIDDFISMVFNIPTLGDAYKYAAYDGLQALAKSAPAAR